MKSQVAKDAEIMVCSEKNKMNKLDLNHLLAGLNPNT